VALLLALECLLWLSQQFQWLPFNGHRGWTVAIAVAVVAVFLMLMVLWFLTPLILRRRFQFSILSLLFLTVAIAIMCDWFAVERRTARDQKAAMEAIQKLGGSGSIGGGSSVPNWLRTLLGDFFDIRRVCVIDRDATDDDFGCLKALSDLYILRSTGI
jgi:hypothetical protein